MTHEQAKSELMQIYMSLSEEKKQALDVLMAQADGEYISREAVIDIIEDVCPIYGNDYRYILREEINELPSVAIPSAEPTYHAKMLREFCRDRDNLDEPCEDCPFHFYDGFAGFCVFNYGLYPNEWFKPQERSDKE